MPTRTTKKSKSTINSVTTDSGPRSDASTMSRAESLGSKAGKRLKEIKEKETVKKEIPTKSFVEAVGRRKTASARVRLFAVGNSKEASEKVGIIINDRPLERYFSLEELRQGVLEPLKRARIPLESYFISVKVAGGGIRGQAEAVRHGIARALVKEDQTLRKKLKRPGFLKRDPRMKERRKFGLKKARKAPQWSKR